MEESKNDLFGGGDDPMPLAVPRGREATDEALAGAAGAQRQRQPEEDEDRTARRS